MYLTLIYKNEAKHQGRERILDKAIRLARKLSDAKVKQTREESRGIAIARITEKTHELCALLNKFNTTILKERELLEFLALIPNGGRNIGINSNSLLPTSNNIKTLPETIVKYPNGHLGASLCNTQIFFGAHIQFQGNSENDSRFGAILSLKQYSANTANVSLDPLLDISGEFILTQTYAPIESDVALKIVGRTQAIKINANDLAASQIDELASLTDLIAGQRLSCGVHHNSIMLLADSTDELNGLINDTTKAYAVSGLNVVRETLAQTPVFFAQIPGNGRYICRGALLTSENFADFCPLHNIDNGHHQQNFLNSAVSVLDTSLHTPLYFNYHVKGSKTNPSRGHTLVVGGNDSGKTTLISFLDAQMARFPKHRAIFLDRNQGLRIYLKAMGGRYVSVSPESQDCAMNPLTLPDTKANRDFIKNWFRALLLDADESALPADIAEICDDAIDYCYETLAPKERVLANIARFLPLDFARISQLNRWLRATDDKPAGQYAWVFDNDVDAINLDCARIGFDITYVLDKLPVSIATPIFMYIIERIALSLNGDVTSIVIDEMWQVLRAPFWQSWLAARLPSIRKEYGHIIGMTQSPQTIVDSQINAELLDNLASMILFPNPKASAKIYQDKLGLNDAEFSFIKNTSPDTRLFLYKHDTESHIAKLNLAMMPEFIRIFSANQKSNALLDSCIKEVGNNPQDWLPIFMQVSGS
ncbi:MAG: hypothetical protein CMJ94_02955 [Planctomycetes bacterium]|nr:hypothetical protein [Planctomycetota bacterium]